MDLGFALGTEVQMTSNVSKLAIRWLAALAMGSGAVAATLPSVGATGEHAALNQTFVSRVSPYRGDDYSDSCSYAWMRQDAAGKDLTK
jgi:hypothetical protein